MEITISERPDSITHAALFGRLDVQGAERIGLRMTAGVATPGRNAIVDLSGVDFVSSMGIRLLIATARALDQKGARMVLFGAQPLVQEVFDDAALDQVLGIVASQEQALAAVAAG